MRHVILIALAAPSALALTACASTGAKGTYEQTLTMACYPVAGGTATDTASQYVLRGNRLIDGSGATISTTNLRRSHYTGDDGQRRAMWVEHIRVPYGAVRSVYWADEHGDPRFHYSQTYDFSRQRIIDQNGRDSCNAARRTT